MAIFNEPKISDLIEELNRVMDAFGDIPVRSSDPGGYFDRQNIDVEVVDNGRGKWLSIEGEG